MSLLAVRHGQASFGADDYDKLSDKGWQQMRRLGEWLAGHGERFDATVIGGMRRHRESFDALAEGYAARDIALPAPAVDPRCNEFDHRAVLEAFVRAQQEHPAVVASAGGRSGGHREIFALLHAAISHWASGALDQEVEAWSEFCRRTRTAGSELANGRTLLVSSGGVIAQLAAASLDAPDARAVELNLSLRNSALTEFVPIAGRMRLGSWNALPHLAEQRELWTHY